jgi:hypothetical protein
MSSMTYEEREELHLTECDENGRHPALQHLVMFEFERHQGLFIMTAIGHSGSALLEYDTFEHICNEDEYIKENLFGYLDDDYLEYLK